jgi:hypothetical protein
MTDSGPLDIVTKFERPYCANRADAEPTAEMPKPVTTIGSWC